MLKSISRKLLKNLDLESLVFMDLQIKQNCFFVKLDLKSDKTVTLFVFTKCFHKHYKKSTNLVKIF